MKNLYSLLFLFFGPVVVFCQNETISSLKNDLVNATEDTSKVNTLNAITLEFLSINQYDSAMRYAVPSVALAEKLNDQAGAGIAYRNLATYFLHRKEYGTTRTFLVKSLAAFKATNNREALADTYQSLSYVYEKQSNYASAFEDYKLFIAYRDSLANEKNTLEASFAANEFELNKRKAINSNNATAAAAFEEQNKSTMNTAVIILGLLALAIVGLIIALVKTKSGKDAIVAKQHEHILILEDEVAKLKENAIQTAKQHAETIAPLMAKAATAEAGKQAVVVANKPEADYEIELETSIPLASNFIQTAIFSSFTAMAIDGKIELRWQTEDEHDTAYFEIDKSVDNKQFVTIETLDAVGAGNNEYMTMDLLPLPGDNYFRIKLVDKKGNMIYSQTQAVQSPKNVLLELVRYPNPVKDLMMVTAVNSTYPLLVSIYNKVGQKIFNIQVAPGTTPIYLTDIEPGNYTLQMKSQGKTVTQQLTKV